MRYVLAFCLAAASPALADIDAALNDHILPGHAALVDATANLASAAEADCTPEAMRPAFNAAYDAWIAIGHVQFGPIEDEALSLAMSFWPDPKDTTGKTISRLTAANDPIVDDRAGFGEVSAAVQGFTALERLIYEEQPDAEYACRFVRAVSYGLADKAAFLSEGWAAHAELMRAPGQNDRYRSETEVQRTVYTSLSTGLEFMHDQRLGRPLGTFDRPRPRRAEARRSERSLRNISVSLEALEELARTFPGELTETKKSFADARARAGALDDPALQGVAEPAKRLRVEALQQTVRSIQQAVIDEIGQPLGIRAGFNALDGD
ncbi:MAG: imelysin family protein [Pseudomonadota bacterium]